MQRGKQFTSSLWASVAIGAVGAFIFWGVFAGWFSSGEIDTQIAAPAASTKQEE